MPNFIALTPKEREVVYKDLVKGNRPIQIQITGEKQKQGKVLTQSEGEIIFELPFLDRFIGEFEAVITFSLPPEVYFLKAKIRENSGQYFFKETINIYRLQRRETFRLKIPELVDANVTIDNLGTFRLNDISQGGFGIQVSAKVSHSFKSKTQLKVNLVVMGERFAKVICEVRNARVQTLDKQTILVGFKFLELDQGTEERLFKVITEISRQYFRK